MNETIQTILNRRSVRAFKPDMPDSDALDAIIQCGLFAPSAVNTQNWHFSVVKNADLIARINSDVREALPDAAKERMTTRNQGDPQFSVFYFAPVVIFISIAKDDSWAAVNGALATENICLAAESLGLGTCIIGMANLAFNSPNGPEYEKTLQFPEGYRSLHAVCVGYKAMDMAAPERAPNKAVVIE